MIRVDFTVPDLTRLLYDKPIGDNSCDITALNTTPLLQEINKLDTALSPHASGVNSALKELFQAVVTERSDGTLAEQVLPQIIDTDKNKFKCIADDLSTSLEGLNTKFQALITALKSKDPVVEIVKALKRYFEGFDIVKFLKNIAPGNKETYMQAFGFSKKPRVAPTVL